MSDVVLLEDAVRDLSGLLAELSLGETVTLLDADEKPVALLVALQPETPRPPVDMEEWRRQWDEMAQAIGEAWQGEQGAVETLLEMRR